MVKTYITWEMIKELTENPEKEFKRVGDELKVSLGTDNCLLWKSGYPPFNINHIWEEVKEPVDFITAIKSGKHVGVKYSGVKYEEMSLPDLFYELQQKYSGKTIRQMILNGKWYIED